MKESRIYLAFYYVPLLSLLFITESNAHKLHCSCSRPSSCGNHEVIVQYPFRFRFDPEGCGMKDYELECENDRPVLYIGSGRYYVLGINYDNYRIRVIDDGIQKGNYSSLPLHFLTPNMWYEELNVPYDRIGTKTERAVIANIKCGKLSSVIELEEEEMDLAVVKLKQTHSEVLTRYFLFGTLQEWGRKKLPEGCGIESLHLTLATSMDWLRRERMSSNDSILFSRFHNDLARGFELGWIDGYCASDLDRNDCYVVDNPYAAYCRDRILLHITLYQRLMNFMYGHHGFAILTDLGECLAARTFCGWMLLCIYLIYKYRRRHLSVFDSIENFLQSQNNLVPISYSYREIRTMTKGFKDKLGEGGFGSVYKGKLRSGHDVAIKMLGKSKANGQEFINEVATIGRIHHVNVVQLIGFCAHGSKRALVYDFMPNGSLEKYISSHEGNSVCSLSCEQMYNVSLGIARGIEYLHRGCDMQILHFDIKPHNILLDGNFTPKVSDFGLAKLYPIHNSVVSLTAARGTMGYMAPELFYKNIGGISYKADVYSFGMLLMEMAGRKKSMNAHVETLSKDYFPSWRFDQFNDDNEVDTRETRAEEVEKVKKMVIVALWCIQFKPNDRPPMNRVVEMLEGGLELLKMPPKPFITSSEMVTKDN
ncbi:rust resistance kinase Lr10-like [Impatiens glandulifera]|uniref:rust resistance kinase Lr10-like n=1 Tax=Impatiens glandulifera TaxID=253017 RepID=UPI001FB19E78|nr:rust resistance kinase Lr10-like [Impatiens glandulifera]